MKPVVDKLTAEDIINLSAFAASRPVTADGRISSR
jgi:cytochrome c553